MGRNAVTVRRSDNNVSGGDDIALPSRRSLAVAFLRVETDKTRL
jgi:hypothetical protein